jgi:hypothetical protein
MNTLKPLHTAITMGLLVIGLSACTTTAPYQPPVTSFDFNTCQKQALVKDRSAVSGKTAALYHKAASDFAYCIDMADNETDIGDLLQAQALVTLNYFKAGDMSAAQDAFADYRSLGISRDLYFPDGTSVRDNLALLMSYQTGQAENASSLLNAKPTLKSEIRRINYWQTH